MNEFSEFNGKNLDEAIEAACRYYDVKRDKLEIEILSGGSSGIFGLVGVKKAAIKARPRRAMSLQEMNEARDEPRPTPRREEPQALFNEESRTQLPSRPTLARESVIVSIPAREIRAEMIQSPNTPTYQQKIKELCEPQTVNERDPRDLRREGEDQRPKQSRQLRPEHTEKSASRLEYSNADKPVEIEKGLAKVNMTNLDPQTLEQAVRHTVTNLLASILPEPKFTVEITQDRVNVLIDDENHSGLIIGREGQTLSSLQYLLNRIVARSLGCSVRVQIDTGAYRERQDEKLRLMALRLADKANTSGRTQSTKPLSSYHRRVVHVTLQDNADVFTRSKGDGPMKRVLLVPKKKNDNR